MTNKNTFAIFGILAVLLMSLGMVSATSSIYLDVSPGVSGPSSVTENSGSFTFNFEVNYTKDADEAAVIDFSESYTNFGTISIPSVTLNGTANESKTVTGTISGYSNMGGNSLQAFISAETSAYKDNETSFIVSITDVTTTNDTLCELEGYDEDGDLEISDFDINNKGEGSDDEWQYLDQIEIVVEVENTNNDDDIEDVEVKIVILDDKIEDGGIDVTNDFDIDDEVLDDIGRLRDSDEESVTFIIDELPSDIEDGIYYLYIMAYEDGNEAEQCISEIDSGDYYFEFAVESVDYDESIVVRGAEFENIINTYCGQQNLEIAIPVYNLGDDEEEKILVNLYNSEVGIDEYIVIEDLDNGDKEVVTFFINIPSYLTKEKYYLDVIVSFDWDDDEDDNDPLSYDEETSDTSIKLNILDCKDLISEPSVSANLESEAEVGTELIIKVLITNNNEDNDFIISLSDFEEWATLVSITPQTASIKKGEFAEVMITLKPTITGKHSFNIDTIVNGESYSQPVSVNIAEESGIFAKIRDAAKDSIYIIAGIVILLIIIISIVIVKVSRRQTRPEF